MNFRQSSHVASVLNCFTRHTNAMSFPKDAKAKANRARGYTAGIYTVRLGPDKVGSRFSLTRKYSALIGMWHVELYIAS